MSAATIKSLNSKPDFAEPDSSLSPDFVTIDFETANPDIASICQVGIAAFKHERATATFSSLVDPQDDFWDSNVCIHGITEADVIGAPIFPDIYPHLARFLVGRIVVSHTPFDRSALRKALKLYELSDIDCRWLDSARVARRTWTDCAKVGYGLEALAAKLGIEFDHHDALSDAIAAGTVLIRAISESQIELENWLTKSLKPLGKLSKSNIGSLSRVGNPNGALSGECLAFTGALHMPRREAAEMAAQAGCSVGSSVTRKTTILVTGDQDIARLRPGEVKSRKLCQAETSIRNGRPIRIIGESDFLALCALQADSA